MGISHTFIDLFNKDQIGQCKAEHEGLSKRLAFFVKQKRTQIINTQFWLNVFIVRFFCSII